jgi:signal transduction histidine kinase
MCATVDFGTCICGKAAAMKDIKFVDCVNEDHDIRPEGMTPHGHYSVPFFDSNKNILGVIVLYVEHGHKSKPEEFEFLRLIALCLGSLTQRFLYEDQLKVKNQLEMGRAMMATIAHEINNPLMIASGKIQQCLKKGKNIEPEKSAEILNGAYLALNRISESVKLLQDLIRETKFDLSNYSPDGSEKFFKVREEEEDSNEEN